MTIIALIRAALAAIAAYFEHANKRLIYDLIEVSEQRQIRLRAQIEALREAATEEATQNADVIFRELQREKEKYEKHLIP